MGNNPRDIISIKSYVCITMNNTGEPKETWEEKVRLDYKDILSEEQMEATIRYWRGIITRAKEEQREADARIAEKHKIPGSEYRDTNIGMNEAANAKVEEIASSIRKGDVL